jgi:hypothetical protein
MMHGVACCSAAGGTAYDARHGLLHLLGLLGLLCAQEQVPAEDASCTASMRRWHAGCTPETFTTPATYCMHITDSDL